MVLTQAEDYGKLVGHPAGGVIGHSGSWDSGRPAGSKAVVENAHAGLPECPIRAYMLQFAGAGRYVGG